MKSRGSSWSWWWVYDEDGIVSVDSEEGEADVLGEGGCIDSDDIVMAEYRADVEWGIGGMLYIKLRIFIRSAYVSC